MIPSPRRTDDYPDRNLECQEAIEASVITVIDDARSAGWTVSDLTAALVELADNLMHQHHANDHTDQWIADVQNGPDK